jgi:hypothetical protein
MRSQSPFQDTSRRDAHGIRVSRVHRSIAVWPCLAFPFPMISAGPTRRRQKNPKQCMFPSYAKRCGLGLAESSMDTVPRCQSVFTLARGKVFIRSSEPDRPNVRIIPCPQNQDSYSSDDLRPRSFAARVRAVARQQIGCSPLMRVPAL